MIPRNKVLKVMCELLDFFFDGEGNAYVAVFQTTVFLYLVQEIPADYEYSNGIRPSTIYG